MTKLGSLISSRILIKGASKYLDDSDCNFCHHLTLYLAPVKIILFSKESTGL